jgi:hypothetical protein
MSIELLHNRCCQIFLVQHTKTGNYICTIMTTKYTKWPQNATNDHKIYQMTTKYTKWPQNIPKDHNIYQMGIRFTNIINCKTLQNLPKLWLWVSKIYHLAALCLMQLTSTARKDDKVFFTDLNLRTVLNRCSCQIPIGFKVVGSNLV